MPAIPTVVMLVHGANQADKDAERNKATWQEALSVNVHAERVNKLIQGRDNQLIAQHHEAKHQGRDYPHYTEWATVWYGDVWPEIDAVDRPFSDRLNSSFDEDQDDRATLLELGERGVMKKHFDELVPFYELAVIRSSRKTLYETICARFLEQLSNAASGKNFVVIGHSMGCAVSYNVMSHISLVMADEPCSAIEGALSADYTNMVRAFVESGSKCFGLMTFGNYTGYNWCQRLNHRILAGEAKQQYVYPQAVGRWFNFWTVFGGDPYIIDDQLADDMVDNEDDQYEDVAVWRIPGTNVGHGRAKWFKREKFTTKLWRKMAYHLYL